LSLILTLVTLTSSTLAQSCADKGSLAARYQHIVNFDDANHDGFVTGDELYGNFVDQDTDKDGCISTKEWTDVWASNNFSVALALQRLSDLPAPFANTSDPICTINYGFLKGNANLPRVPMIPDFIGGTVASLVTLCLDSTKVDMVKDNCDCAELKNTCHNDMVVNSTTACANFRTIDKFGLVCDAKGYIATRISNVLDEIDTDSDDVITGLEQYNDFAMNIDKDNNSCISLQEWSDHLIVDLKFSPEFSKQRLTEIAADITVPCVINYSSYKTSNLSVPRAVFAQRNLQTLVNICANDADLYRTNCDCAQLKVGCLNDPNMSANVVCQTYINGA